MGFSIAEVRTNLINIRKEDLSHKELIEKYSELLENIGFDNSENNLKAIQIFMEAIIDENISIIISRKILTTLEENFFKIMPDNSSKLLIEFLLEKIRPRVVSFEEQLANVRQYLASIYEKERDWTKVASILASIPLETGQKKYPVDYKMETYIKIVRSYLKIDDLTLAESYINRASLLQPEIKDEKTITQFKLYYAKVLDHRHKFVEAAQKYNELSYNIQNLTEKKCNKLLRNSIICTILAPVGKQRTQLLTTLCKDDRCMNTPEFSILTKLYLDRLIRPQEVAELNKLLLPRHKLKTVNGVPIFERSIIEHNLVAVSKIYKNIYIDKLGQLLDIDPRVAEKIAGCMMYDGRLEGSIDQVENCIYFKREDSLLTWDAKIKSVCESIDKIMENMAADPATREWMRNHFEHQMIL